MRGSTAVSSWNAPIGGCDPCTGRIFETEIKYGSMRSPGTMWSVSSKSDASASTYGATLPTSALQRSALICDDGACPNTYGSPSRGGEVTDPLRLTSLCDSSESTPTDTESHFAGCVR
jgi:hypothetical protein